MSTSIPNLVKIGQRTFYYSIGQIMWQERIIIIIMTKKHRITKGRPISSGDLTRCDCVGMPTQKSPPV